MYKNIRIMWESDLKRDNRSWLLRIKTLAYLAQFDTILDSALNAFDIVLHLIYNANYQKMIILQKKQKIKDL